MSPMGDQHSSNKQKHAANWHAVVDRLNASDGSMHVFIDNCVAATWLVTQSHYSCASMSLGLEV